MNREKTISSICDTLGNAACLMSFYEEITGKGLITVQEIEIIKKIHDRYLAALNEVMTE